jgi:dTMP kinase
MAYQGYGHRLDLDVLRAITAFATGGLVPDLTVYLDIDVVLGLQRKELDSHNDSAQWNRMEQKALAYHQRVRQGYLEMARDEPERWLVIDASRPSQVVQQAVRQRTAQLLGLDVVAVER